MKKLTLAIAIAASAAFAGAQVVHRPISDFIAAQEFTANFFETSSGKVMFIDYVGEWNGYLIDAGHADLGTQVTGSVTERPLPGGGCNVHVVLRATNAYAWGLDPANGGATSIGYRFGEILAGGNPMLGTAELVLDWKSSAPAGSAPLGISAWGNDGTLLKMVAHAQGELRPASGYPQGTPGYLHTTQLGLLGRTQGAFAETQFATEFLRWGPTGR